MAEVTVHNMPSVYVMETEMPISMVNDLNDYLDEYKEDKDIEIQKLHEELDSFKKTIEENNSLYESMLDKTTQSLEKIISNTESLS